MTRVRTLFSIIAASALAFACSGKENAAPSGEASSATKSSTDAAGGPVAPPTGKVIVVELNSDEKGNYFKPAKLEVHRGDVIRFTLKIGVHNIDFLPDSNPGKAYLPHASDMLQLPGQTLDMPINLAPGKYYFQCDPHAATGMIGHLEVER